jgi:hypothetical protein
MQPGARRLCAFDAQRQNEGIMIDVRSPDFIAKATRIVTLLTACAGLFWAIVRPENHDVTKASYSELSKGIEKLNAGLAANHDDIVMLRGYVAKMDNQSLFVVPSSVEDAGVTAAVEAHAPPRAVKVTSPALPHRVISLNIGAGGGAPAAPAAPVDAMLAPPVLHEPAAPYHPPTFDSVLKAAK